MSWFYYQYLLVTALYMLEPWERTVFSILCVLAWPGRGGVRALGWGGGGGLGAKGGGAAEIGVLVAIPLPKVEAS